MSEPEPRESRLRSLMIAGLDGDKLAYETLLRELAILLRSYYSKRLPSGQRSHAEDLVQETLIAIHGRRVTYDRQRRFSSWAFAIARYKLIDHFRQHHLRVDIALDDEQEYSDGSSEDSVTARGDVEKALGTLPKQQRELISKVKIEGYSIAETAGGAGLSEAAVKVGIHRGLKTLAARFRRQSQ